MASKTDVTKRKEAKEQFKTKRVSIKCGHEIKRVLYSPVKGRAKLVWWCDIDGREDPT